MNCENESTDGAAENFAALQEKWETSGAQERQEGELESAATMSQIFHALNDNKVGGYVCGTAQGEFQVFSIDRIKPILDESLYLESDGGEDAQALHER